MILGDPGGDPKGRSNIEDCLTICDQAQRIVKQEAPAARFVLNLWAIAEWEGFPSPSTPPFWLQKIKLSRAAVTSPGLVGPGCGVAFPLHNYCRSLAPTCYSEANLQRELYPTAEDVAALRKRGATPLLGWPYFLVDKADDGFLKPNNAESGGQSSSETCYLRAVADCGRGPGSGWSGRQRSFSGGRVP